MLYPLGAEDAHTTSSEEILLYTVSLNSVRHNVLNFMTCLTPHEKNQANSYYTQELSENYIISHAILRQILSDHTKIYANEIEFTVGPYGKPYLKNNQQSIEFNMSHSKDMLYIVVTKDIEVGVDVEFKDNNINITELQNLVLSKQEADHLNTLESQTQKKDFFYNIWTLKEAIVKATGQGLSYPISQINLIDEMFSVKTSESIKIEESILEHKLHLLSCMMPSTSLNINKNYSFAIASKSILKNIMHLELNTMTGNAGPIFFIRSQKQEK
jgi:4'-phosphopantetheinyl transferase